MASSSQRTASVAAGPQQEDAEGLSQHQDALLDAGRKAGRTLVEKLYVEKVLEQCDDKHEAIKELRATLKGASLQWLCKEYYQIWAESRRTLTVRGTITSEAEMGRLVEQCRSAKNVTCIWIWEQHFAAQQQPQHDREDALPCWVPVIRVCQVLTKLREVSIWAPGCFQLLHVLDCAAASVTPEDKAAASSRAPPAAGLAGRLMVLALHDTQHVMGTTSLQQLGKLAALKELSLTCKRLTAQDAEACEKAAAASRQLQALSKLTLCAKEACSKELLRAFLSELCQQLTSLHLSGASAEGIGDDPSVLEGLKQLRELSTGRGVGPAAVMPVADGLLKLQMWGITAAAEAGLAELLDAAGSLQQLLLGDLQLSSSTAASVFNHGSLQVLEAGGIDCGPEWRGVVLEDSQLEELVCKCVGPTELQPDPFANMPVFHKLRKWEAISPSWPLWPVAAGAQQELPHRFLGVRRTIHNHSRTLEELVVDVWAPGAGAGTSICQFDEPLPASLSTLKVLVLHGAGPHVLATLQQCSNLTCLEEVMLSAPRQMLQHLGLQRPLVLEDLRWLAQLPKLRSVEITGGGVLSVSEEVEEELRRLLPRRVEYAEFEQ